MAIEALKETDMGLNNGNHLPPFGEPFGWTEEEIQKHGLRELLQDCKHEQLDNNSTKVDKRNDELISRQDAIDAIEESRRLNHHSDGKEACAHEYEHRHFLKILMELPSAQGDAEFINWLLDEVWDEEMWELNYRAFPELLCRRFVKAGWLKEEGGKYVRLDKQTGCNIRNQKGHNGWLEL